MTVIENNPGVKFVLEDGTEKTIPGFYMQGLGKVDEFSNAEGIYTRNDNSERSNAMLTDQTIEENMRLIDESLDKLQDIKESKELAFSSAGYGQYMLDAIKPGSKTLQAPDTFVYLSEQLYERFGYINPGAKLTDGVRAAIKAQQEALLNVSDEVLQNQIDNELDDVLAELDGGCQK